MDKTYNVGYIAGVFDLFHIGHLNMFKKYHFDVQFSGSDYEHDPAWLSEKEFLEKNGATMVFFLYTQSTSSTKLKKAIESKIKQ